MAGKATPAPTFADAVAARDAAIALADKMLADAMESVHVARALRDEAISKAQADFAEALKALGA